MYKRQPYQIYGGLSFYDRKEIKDILAYLALIDNPNADTEFMRVINEPKRGIGTVTLDKLISYAEENGLSYLQMCIRDRFRATESV